MSIFLLSGTKRYSIPSSPCAFPVVGPEICHSQPHGVWYLETRNRTLDTLNVPSVSSHLGSLSRCKEIYVCIHTFTYTFTHLCVCMYLSQYIENPESTLILPNTIHYQVYSSLYPFCLVNSSSDSCKYPQYTYFFAYSSITDPASHLLALTLLSLSPTGSNLLGKLYL